MLRRNVLIFHQAALGDFIITWPLAMALSRILPQSRIFYVTHSQKGKLAERVLRVESADAESGWHNLFAESPALPEPAQKLLQASQLVVSFTAGASDRLAAGVKAVAPKTQVISIDTKRETAGHVTESILEQLHSQPALGSALDQMLRSVASRGVGYSRSPGGGIVIHPGAGKEQNRWPPQRYLELIRMLRADDRQVRVLLGETEREKWPASLIGEFESAADVRYPATLLDLLDELASAAVFIGNDSGPGHLAGIIGVPTVSLFGATDSTRWRPLGPNVSIVQHSPIGELPSDTVIQTVTRHLKG